MQIRQQPAARRHDGGSYDALNRVLTQGTTSYAYNGDGTLVAQTTNGVTTRYTQDLAAPLSQILADDSATYLYGQQRLAARTGAAPTWSLGDALGSVRGTMDNAGTLTAVSHDDPWGTVQGDALAPFGCTGELQQGGNVWLRARWYQAGQGRFVGRDPFAGWGEQPYSLHPYQYGYSDPVRRVDPRGRAIEDDIIDRDDLQQCSAIESPTSVGCYTVPDEQVYGQRTILGLILHDTGLAKDTCEGVIDWWARDIAHTSAHYLVGATGEIYRTVPESAIAHHAGGSPDDPALATFYIQAEHRYRSFGGFALNRVTVGIEVLGQSARRENEFPQVQRAAVVALARDIARRYDILPINIQSHDEIQRHKIDGEGLKRVVREAVQQDRQQRPLPKQPTSPR